jgi:hypothetical protein
MTGTVEPQHNEAATAGVADDIWRWAKRQAIGQMDLSLGARECWRILEGFPPGSCFPSHYHIATTMRKSVSAVRRYLKKLEGSGYVEISERYDENERLNRHRPRGQTSNTYTILDQPDPIARAVQIVQEWRAKQQR